MPKLFQIHGMLLEEALLHLLRYSGYRPVTVHTGDPTLRRGTAGLEVMGRGEHHQIDAIADYTIPQPFVNPARLLIEAKFKDSGVGIEIVRNAVGVLKDVSEYWGRSTHGSLQPRFHYQYAILASSGFSDNAQRYAVAHDIYLIPFEQAPFFKPVLDAIRAVVPAGVTDRRLAVDLGIDLSELRARVRAALSENHPLDTGGITAHALVPALESVLGAIRQVGFSILAVAVGRVPLVLTPAEGLQLDDLQGDITVRIYWDDDGWYLRRPRAGGDEEELFSFDVPPVLLRKYIEQDQLSPRRALDLKGEALSEIKAVVTETGGRVRLLRFKLDQEWLEVLRGRLDT